MLARRRRGEETTPHTRSRWPGSRRGTRHTDGRFLFRPRPGAWGRTADRPTRFAAGSLGGCCDLPSCAAQSAYGVPVRKPTSVRPGTEYNIVASVPAPLRSFPRGTILAPPMERISVPLTYAVKPGRVPVAREPGPPASTPPRLLDRVRETVRARHYSRRTEKADVAWIRRFILFQLGPRCYAVQATQS
jgi:integrase-like protein